MGVPSPRRPPRTAVKRVHGDDLLYDFLQHLLTEENETFSAVPQLLLQTMAVWLPLDVYKRWPVLRPYVVRDPGCRGNRERDLPDEWGSPDARGYLRDDNSLIKGVPRSLQITGPRGRRLAGSRMGSEFVAAHIWRTVVGADTLASRIPALNSFVPNLAWLPGQIAKLTDREGSVVQETAQALSWQIYRDAAVAPHLRDIVEECWRQLPRPARQLTSFGNADLNWFKSTPRFFAVRSGRLGAVIAALRHVHAGLPLDEKVITTRYTEGLPSVPREAISDLLASLELYLPPEDRHSGPLSP